MSTNKAARGLLVFRLGFIALMLVLTSLPYFLLWHATPPGAKYTWIMPPYPQDSLAYMAWTQQAAHGNFLLQLKYTTEPHSPFLFHPFFLVCGWLTRLLGCDIGVIHLLVKGVGVILFFFALFKYLDHLKLTTAESVAATLFTGLSSGLGAFLAWFGDATVIRSFRPVDTWLPDANTFWALLWNPLFPFSLTLTVLTIFWLDRGTSTGKKADLWLSGLAAGLLALIHPYSQLLLFVLVLTFTLVRQGKDSFGYLWRFAVAAFPFCLYLGLVTLLVPIVSQHSASGTMKSRPLTSYLLGFGIPLALVPLGVLFGRLEFLKRYWQLLFWFLLSLVFAYLPVWFQRKFIFGAHVPLAILAGVSVCIVISKLITGPKQVWAITAALLLLLPAVATTHIYNFKTQTKMAQANQGSSYYLNSDLAEGLPFLKTNSQPRDIVFATPLTSSLIPAFSGNTVLWGHWAMSVDSKQKQQWFQELCSPANGWDETKRLQEFWGGVGYVFADGPFREGVRAGQPPWNLLLKQADKVFENGSITIYRHRRPPA
jgi:hypothetical protein